MKLLSWIILISSTFIYVLPFWFSVQLWWLIFFFPISLIYVGLSEKVSFKEGYLWGLCTYTLHLSGILWGTMSLAHGSYLVRIIPSLFIICYQSLYTGLWFWIMGQIRNYYNRTAKIYQHAIMWGLSMWLYTLWIDRYSLFLFDRCEGYFLMHPLLPLAELPALLQIMPYIGKPLLTLAFYALTTLVALLLVKPTRMILSCCLIALIPWVLSIALWYGQQSNNAPHWLGRVAHLPKKFLRIQNISVIARVLREEVKQVLESYPDADIIIIPESAVYSPHVLNTPLLAAHLGSDHGLKPIDLLIGSFHDEQGEYRNSCYWVKDGIVQCRFDKRHAMLMIERIPSFFKYPFMKDMYFSTTPEIKKSDNTRPLLHIADDISIVPYICSELFFNEYPDDIHGSMPIILMSNDSWASVGYVRHLMYLIVRFRAIQWQRDILYVSYHYALLCDKKGHIHQLQSFQ